MSDLTMAVWCDIYFPFIFLTEVRQKVGGDVPGPSVARRLLVPGDPVVDGPAGAHRDF